MLSVKQIQNWKADNPGRYLVKLKNLFFKQGGKISCDIYLEFFNGDWVIAWKGHKHTTYTTKAQIEYLISKAETLDQMITNKNNNNHLMKIQFSSLANAMDNVDTKKIMNNLKKIQTKVNYHFGLPGNPDNTDVINEDGEYYKFLAQYQSHYNSNGETRKSNKPFMFFIKEKNFSEAYRIDLDRFLRELYNFKNILHKMEREDNKIPVKEVYDNEKGEEIWTKPKYGDND